MTERELLGIDLAREPSANRLIVHCGRCGGFASFDVAALPPGANVSNLEYVCPCVNAPLPTETWNIGPYQGDAPTEPMITIRLADGAPANDRDCTGRADRRAPDWAPRPGRGRMTR